MRKDNGITQAQTIYVPTDRLNPDLHSYSVYRNEAKIILRAHVHEFHDMLPLSIEEFRAALLEAYENGKFDVGTDDEYVDKVLLKHGVVKTKVDSAQEKNM